VRAADCRWLVVSYSDEGLIGLDDLCDLLAAEGALTLRSTGYVKYPGGKQSMTRTIRNRELALVVDRRAACGVGSTRRLLAEVRIARAMSGSFHPARIRGAFAVRGEGIVPAGVSTGSIPMRHFWRFTGEPPAFRDDAEAEAFRAALSRCAVGDAREEIDILSSIVQAEEDPAERRFLLLEIMRLLNRIAHRKYRDQFLETLARLRSSPWLGDAGPSFAAGLQSIAARAERRFAPGAPASR
jgi:hypothetical protein